ncbi:Mbov_0400 family ICE element protein [Mesomycoplasma ovipneumoniae]|uniref:Mbov_0400 family ICE element protein n=1 Tax=Mesomycoplasma ovipneumoniae TaxID=29562 RepID=UPI003080A9DE
MANKDLLKLKKFSPFKGLVFDSLAQEIKARPVIIFHDTENDHYYYIKARDARLDNGKLNDPFDGEILIPKSDKSNTLFTKDSYLDCSRVFYIGDSQLEELIKNHPETEILDLKELEFSQAEKMFDKIYEFVTSKPPYIVISSVSYDSKTKITKPKVWYASDQHLNNDYKTIRFKTKKIKELKDKLHKEKNQISLDLFKGILNDAWGEYWKEKVYNPLFQWIRQNKFVQKGLNSIEIIHEYNKLSSPIVPTTIEPDTIYNCLVNNRWRDILNSWLSNDRWDFILSEKLLATDFKFMIDWFEKNNLDINMESFSQFRKSIQESQNWGQFFYFYKLKNKLKQEISKLEEKQQQIQNQQTIRDELTYQNLRLQTEKWVQEAEDGLKRKEEDLKKFVAKHKIKM